MWIGAKNRAYSPAAPPTTDKFLNSASYTGSPQPSGFLVSIDGGSYVSAGVTLDGSGNAYLHYDLTSAGFLPGSGAHSALVIAVDSTGQAISPTTQYGFTL